MFLECFEVFSNHSVCHRFRSRRCISFILVNMVIFCFLASEATSAPSPILHRGSFIKAHSNKLSKPTSGVQTRAKPPPCSTILNQRLPALWRDKHKDGQSFQLILHCPFFYVKVDFLLPLTLWKWPLMRHNNTSQISAVFWWRED